MGRDPALALLPWPLPKIGEVVEDGGEVDNVVVMGRRG